MKYFTVVIDVTTVTATYQAYFTSHFNEFNAAWLHSAPDWETLNAGNLNLVQTFATNEELAYLGGVRKVERRGCYWLRCPFVLLGRQICRSVAFLPCFIRHR